MVAVKELSPKPILFVIPLSEIPVSPRELKTVNTLVNNIRKSNYFSDITSIKVLLDSDHPENGEKAEILLKCLDFAAFKDSGPEESSSWRYESEIQLQGGDTDVEYSPDTGLTPISVIKRASLLAKQLNKSLTIYIPIKWYNIHYSEENDSLNPSFPNELNPEDFTRMKNMLGIKEKPHQNSLQKILALFTRHTTKI